MEASSIRGNGWKKFVAPRLVWMETALLVPAQTLTTRHNFSFDEGALPDFATPTQGRDGKILKGLYPVSRIGEVKEVVDAALFLTDARFTSGEILHVEGGAHAGKW